MKAAIKALGIDRLSVEDRLALVYEIWDSIADEAVEPLLSAEQLAELSRRSEEHDADPASAIPWEQAKAAAIKRLQS